MFQQLLDSGWGGGGTGQAGLGPWRAQPVLGTMIAQGGGGGRGICPSEGGEGGQKGDGNTHTQTHTHTSM